MTKYEIVSNQVQYSLTHRNVEKDLLSFCQQHQITVIAHTPLARGGLVSSPLFRKRQAMDTLKKLVEETGQTVAQVALNWCLSRPNVVVIPKSDKIERAKDSPCCRTNCGSGFPDLYPG